MAKSILVNVHWCVVIATAAAALITCLKVKGKQNRHILVKD